MNITPKLGSKWTHHNGLEYTVILIANTGHANPKYPVTIIYKGENGNIWAKPVNNFYENLTPKGFNGI
jgi:hypothetical protein